MSPDSGTVIQEIASRIATHGGSALIADYGHNGDKSDTLRVFLCFQYIIYIFVIHYLHTCIK